MAGHADIGLSLLLGEQTLGPELILNPTYITTANWSTYTNSVLSVDGNGHLICAAFAANFNGIDQNVNGLIVGAKYRLSVLSSAVGGGEGGGVNLLLGTAPGGAQIAGPFLIGNGISIDFVATAPNVFPAAQGTQVAPGAGGFIQIGAMSLKQYQG